jgi:hypothetical protein
MVAFSGSDPIGVLIGAKRSSGTLIHTIAVHPDHLRQGHGRHLLTSLSSKLAILGPPRIVAEVPEALAPACGLFSACGYVEEAVLMDYIWSPAGLGTPAIPGTFLIPVTIDDLVANDLLGREFGPTCWERSVETLQARKDEIAGFAVASEERIEAYILYIEDEIFGLRTLVEDGSELLKLLLARFHAERSRRLRFGKVHPAEIPGETLVTLGFVPADRHRLLTATARAA